MKAKIESMTALGAHIRAERRAQELRQPDLAAAAGTSVRFIVELERGKPTAQVGKVLDVLRQLGLDLSLSGLSQPSLSQPGDSQRGESPSGGPSSGPTTTEEP